MLFTKGHVCLSYLLSSEHLHRHSHAWSWNIFYFSQGMAPVSAAQECRGQSAQSMQANMSLHPHSHLSCLFPDKNLVPGTLCRALSPREGWWATNQFKTSHCKFNEHCYTLRIFISLLGLTTEMSLKPKSQEDIPGVFGKEPPHIKHLVCIWRG